MPVLDAVATAAPDHRLPQDKLRELARALFEEADPRLARVLAVFDNARIDERAFAMPLEWYYDEHGHKDRSEAYAHVGMEVAERAARGALDAAGLTPEDVGGIVFVSTTGIATPSLDARLANRLRVPADALRVPVWGLGCAGGVAGLNRGADLARAHPERRFLVVALELCSLSFDLRRLNKKTLVAASLFGDGAAAVVVSGDDAEPAPGSAGLRHEAGASHLFPDTERVMGWDVEDEVLDVVISPDIPGIVSRESRGLVDAFMRERADGAAPDHWVLHPGGAKVLDAYSEALDLDERDLRFASAALRAHGNMSSPTVLFALEEALRDGAPAPGETALLAALGPGFASELALLSG